MKPPQLCAYGGEHRLQVKAGVAFPADQRDLLGFRRNSRWPIASGESVSRGNKAPARFVVGRLLDASDKENAHSVLFLSPVSATRQSPAADSDMFGMS